MRRLVDFAIFAAALPLVGVTAGHAMASQCHPAHRHIRAHKVAVHRIHHAPGVGVAMDQARVVAFAKPVKTLFIGNPTIADVTMIDPQHAFVLGKTFGVTNLIALEADGTQVSNQQVTVVNNGAAVTVNRGADQFDYMCTRGHCETQVRPGDPRPYVDNSEQAAAAHEDIGMKNATNQAAQSANGQ